MLRGPSDGATWAAWSRVRAPTWPCSHVTIRPMCRITTDTITCIWWSRTAPWHTAPKSSPRWTARPDGRKEASPVMIGLVRAGLAVLVLACADMRAVPPPPPTPPLRAVLGDPLGVFQLTYYWVATEEDFTGLPDTDLFDRSCLPLAV